MHVLLMDESSKRRHARQVPRDDVKNPFYMAPAPGVDLQAGQASKAYCSQGPLVSLAPTCDSQPASILIA
jgi:hypothetical protein